MNHTIWQPVIEKLPEWIEVRAQDLPGHGLRHKESFSDLQNLTDDVLLQCKASKKAGQPLMLVGWSLGALACIQSNIENSESSDGLMLVSSNPCFVCRDDWSSGIEAEVFDQFAASLKLDFSGTIRRFLSLQVKGSDSGRALLRDLREKILQQAQPNDKSLDAGLAILKQIDLRAQLEQLTGPVCWALGEQDGLVKVELANVLKSLMSQAEVQVYSKSGHAPFLSNTEEFVQQLVAFAATVSETCRC